MTIPTNPVDLAKIGPDDLWIVWSRVPEFIRQRDLTMDAVRFHWLLASPGQQGLQEIAREFPRSLIAAVPYATLSQAQALLGEEASSTPGWVRAALGMKSSVFVLAQDSDGVLRLTTKSAVHQNEQVVLQGANDDLAKVVSEGKRILEVRDWKAIADDVRECAQTKPVKWFYHQRTPEAASRIQASLEKQA